MKLQYYYKGSKPTHSRIQCLEQNTDLQFCIGSEFDAYNFTRPLAESFEDLIVERLLQLRKKYNYLRLWFSGGKDSRIILDTAIKQGIQIDEIIITGNRKIIRDDIDKEKILKKIKTLA